MVLWVPSLQKRWPFKQLVENDFFAIKLWSSSGLNRNQKKKLSKEPHLQQAIFVTKRHCFCVVENVRNRLATCSIYQRMIGGHWTCVPHHHETWFCQLIKIFEFLIA